MSPAHSGIKYNSVQWNGWSLNDVVPGNNQYISALFYFHLSPVSGELMARWRRWVCSPDGERRKTNDKSSPLCNGEKNVLYFRVSVLLESINWLYSLFLFFGLLFILRNLIVGTCNTKINYEIRVQYSNSFEHNQPDTVGNGTDTHIQHPRTRRQFLLIFTEYVLFSLCLSNRFFIMLIYINCRLLCGVWLTNDVTAMWF